MNRVATFTKVSKKQFEEDGGRNYEEIVLPTRATAGSAGYDFFAPFDVDLAPREKTYYPSGVRCKIDGNYVLQMYPKSGLGTRLLLRLANTVAIIDSDYYDADNEGHILVCLMNESDKAIHLDKGKAYCQGLFVSYGITTDDCAQGKRKGGLGSTNK